MSYLVLARKSRPQTFSEVVGQKIIVRTLKNALAAGRVPHGLIFSGIRGTGKTTLARIMAKALNCEHGPTPDPCTECASCREIAAGTSVDLHEIDGASNRGIQEIRDLKENIRFMPTSARFKIIIIDEVHMLTTEAFNALLKTLEEPPDHVYFMFATTELHKVPVTILSRCQRYELKRVARPELIAHFSRLAAQEGVDMEADAVGLIAREASGSVRDGLSLLDQVFSYCGTTVTSQEVAEVLGLVSQEVIAETGEALLAGDLARAMDLLDQVYSHGMDLKRFGTELLTWFRNLMFCCLHREPGTCLDVAEDELARFADVSGRYPLATITSLFNLLLQGFEKAHHARQPRLVMELTFIEAVQAGDVQPVGELLARLDALIAGAGQEVILPARKPYHADTTEKEGPGLPDEPSFRSASGGKASRHDEKKPVVAGGEGAENGSDMEAQEEQPAVPEPQGPAGEVTGAGGVTAPDMGDKSESSSPTDTVQAGSSSESQAETAASSGLSQRELRRRWPDFLDYVRERKPWMMATLQKAAPPRLEGDTLTLSYEESIDCAVLKNKTHVLLLTEFALDFFQQPLVLKFHVADAGDCAAEIEDGHDPRRERQALARDPLVLDALEVFNGQVGAVRVGPRFRAASPDPDSRIRTKDEA